VYYETTWINQVLFPLNYTSILVLNYRKIICDPTLAPEVPAMGIPRLIQRGVREYSVASVRYGLGALYENDRLQTPEGRADFDMGLAQLAGALARNAAQDAMAACMNPEPEEKAYQANFGVTNYETFQAALRRERDEFGVFVKHDRGAIMLVDRYSKIMRQRTGGVSPDILILDKEVEAFLKMEIPILTEYWLAGPAGPERLLAEKSAGTFGHVQVYNPPVYEPDPEMNTGMPLTDSTRRIGNFFTMLNNYLHLDAKDYRTAHRAIKLYDESDRDDFTRIDPEEAVAHCGRWDEHGRLHYDHHVLAEMGKADMFLYGDAESMHVARCWGQMHEEYMPTRLLKGIAETAVVSLSDDQQRDIARGLELYEEMLKLPALPAGTHPTGTTINGHASFFGLVKLSIACPEPHVRAVALAFVQAWRQLYRMLSARFGDVYNPFLCPKKVPSYFQAGLTESDHGPCVMFECTMAHNTAPVVPGGHGVNTLSGLDVDAVIAAFLELARDLDANVQNVRAVAERAGASDNAHQMVFAHYLKCFMAGTAVPPQGAAGDISAKTMQALDEVCAPVIVGKKTLEELADELSVNGPGGVITLAQLNQAATHVAGAATANMATPATFGVSYLTPESNYTAVAELPAAAAGGAHPLAGVDNDVHFGGLMDFYFYYAEQDESAGQGEKRIYYGDEGSDGRGDVNNPFHMGHASFPFRTEQWRRKYNEAHDQESLKHVEVARKVFLAAPIRKQVVMSMARHNVHLPFDFLLARPWMGYVMTTGVLAKGGAETGQTNFGHVDVLVGVNAAQKSTRVGATWTIAAVVHRPECIIHMAHCAYRGILGGAGARFYTEEELSNLQLKHWVVSDRDAPSLIAIPMPYGSKINFEDIDLTGTYEDFTSNRAPHYPTFEWERLHRKFSTLVNPFTRVDMWRGSLGGVNSIMFQGSQYACGREPGRFSERTMNKGHHGPEYAGCAAIRRGTGGMLNPDLVPLVL
jgi:hypothetical protein